MGYAGRLRAAGPLIADQFRMARRVGFDEVELPDALAERQPEAQWRLRPAGLLPGPPDRLSLRVPPRSRGSAAVLRERSGGTERRASVALRCGRSRSVARVALAVAAGPAAAWSPAELFAPCRGDCATAIYWRHLRRGFAERPVHLAGAADDAGTISDDHIVATAVSAATRRSSGTGTCTSSRRSGSPSASASRTRPRSGGRCSSAIAAFPGTTSIVTSVAVSTGLN